MTPDFILDVILVITAAAVGVLGGWAGHWWDTRKQRKLGNDQQRLARDVLADLHALIDDVSADVGAHDDCLAEVNAALGSALKEDTRLVAAALAKILMANNRLREHLGRAEAKLQQQSRTIEAQAEEARTDSLTQLVNRQAFDDEVKRSFAAYRRQGRNFSVVLLEIDPLAPGSDHAGEPLDDRTLARVAGAIHDNAREMDLVARRGHVQFALLLPGTMLDDATTVADRIGAAVTIAQCGDDEAPITLSAGVVQVGPEDSARTLIARASAALDEAKAGGGNRVRAHDGVVIRPSTREMSSPPIQTGLSGVKLSQSTSQKSVPAATGESGWTGPRQCEGEPPYLCARAEFRMSVGRRLAEWSRGGTCLCVILARIDDYRSTIAEYGFDIEPCMRSALWHLIVSTTRDMDLVGLDDQETFAMLLPGADLAAATAVAERLRKSVVERSLATPTGLLQFTVSTGVTEARDGDSAESLLQRTEESLLAAVASGGSSTFYDNGNGPQPCPAENETLNSAL
ncbi:MAG: diguanylate cyclase [Pirellulales bacterium]|nr:diguanylate cyclase [Pirellulales bacterium]